MIPRIVNRSKSVHRVKFEYLVNKLVEEDGHADDEVVDFREYGRDDYIVVVPGIDILGYSDRRLWATSVMTRPIYIRGRLG